MMRSFTFSLALALSALGLSACGFSPVYSAAVVDGAGTISIDEIDGRIGHELRKALQRELSAGLPGVADGATLSIDLDDRIRRLAVQPDEAASRTDLRGRVRYVLETADGAIIGEVRAESSFNVPESPFGDVAAQTAARERLATLLAQRIVADLRIKTSAIAAKD